jgi:hypothetical protein
LQVGGFRVSFGLKEWIGMEWKRENYLRTGLYLLAGVILAGAGFIVPDGGRLGSPVFLTIARTSSWVHPFEWLLMWYSCKVIVFNLGIFFSCDALATWARLFGRRKLSCFLLFLLAIPSIGIIYGGYCLLKAAL